MSTCPAIACADEHIRLCIAFGPDGIFSRDRSPVLRTDACVRAAPITPASGPVLVGRLLGPAPSAFTELEAVRRSHPTFRGLLGLHSCCGPRACQPAFAGLCPQGFDGSVALPAARVATEVNRQLLGLDFHQQHRCTFHGALKSRWTTTVVHYSRTLTCWNNAPFCTAHLDHYAENHPALSRASAIGNR